ncbi:hypothetical protein EDB86DRAFT_2410272 [Lactarius hatsudake]|nr:hypothetical protein EDB86DRAFT_2410272 [Lactarius hatsudake]
MPSVVFVIGFALLAFAYDLHALGCTLPFRSPPRAAHQVRPRSPLEGCLGIEFRRVFHCLSFSKEFFLNAGSLPIRGRSLFTALSRQVSLLPVHIHLWARYHLLLGGTSFDIFLLSCVHGLFGPSSQFPTISGTFLSPRGRSFSSARSGPIVNTARAREILYALRYRVWFCFCPCTDTSLFFLYAIRFGFAIARAGTIPLSQFLWLPPVRCHTLLLFLYTIRSGCTFACARENSHVHAIGLVLSLPVRPSGSLAR